jgi:hypothetical protein
MVFVMKKIILSMTLLFVLLFSCTVFAAESSEDKPQWEYVTTSKDVKFYVDTNSNHIDIKNDDTVLFYMIRVNEKENRLIGDKLSINSTTFRYRIEKSITYNIKTKAEISSNLTPSEWYLATKDSPIHKAIIILIEKLDNYGNYGK